MKNEKTEKEAVRVIAWTGAKGQALSVKITARVAVLAESAYMDGDRTLTGEITPIDYVTMTAYMDGKQAGVASNSKNQSSVGSGTEAGKKGYTNYVGQICYKQDIANQIDAAVKDAIAEAATPEYLAAVVAREEKERIAEENEKEIAKEYARKIKNGLCPKCGTYCDGDCSAN